MQLIPPKLLFDIYHVQIMDGDVIRRIGECGDMIGHIIPRVIQA